MKNKIFQSRDLCLRALDTNSLCAKTCAEMRQKMKRIYKIMRDKKGEGYIDAAVVVFCVMFVIALGVRIFPVLSRRYSLTILQTSW